MISNFLYAIAGGVSVGIFTKLLPGWFGLVTQEQYDDTLHTQRDLRFAVEDRLENYQEMLTQSQALTQECLDEIDKRTRAVKYFQLRLYHVEKYLEQTQKPTAQSAMAAGQILVDRSL